MVLIKEHMYSGISSPIILCSIKLRQPLQGLRVLKGSTKIMIVYKKNISYLYYMG
jgi:hypothetical protein